MKIEAGKYYRTRSGRVIGPTQRAGCSAEKWKFWALGFNEGAPCWTDEGRWSLVVDDHDMDLISEVYVSDTPPADAPAPEVKTLRDEFAKAIVAAFLSRPLSDNELTLEQCQIVWDNADAMMEARQK